VCASLVTGLVRGPHGDVRTKTAPKNCERDAKICGSLAAGRSPQPVEPAGECTLVPHLVRGVCAVFPGAGSGMRWYPTPTQNLPPHADDEWAPRRHIVRIPQGVNPVHRAAARFFPAWCLHFKAMVVVMGCR